MAAASRAIESLLAPADAARSAILRRAGRIVAPLSRDRDLRVAVIATIAIVSAFILTALAPIALLALGPIVLGIPHIVGDVRYLIVRRGLHRVPLLALALVPLIGVTLTNDMRIGLFSVPIAIVAARPSLVKLILALALWSIAFAAAWHYAPISDYVFLHAHNFIGVAIWFSWRRRSRPIFLVPLACFVVGSVVIATGALTHIVTTAHTDRPIFGLDLGYLMYTTAPARTLDLAFRLVLLFAFAQSVHYAVWLRLIPEDDRERRGPRGFVASYRALIADFGPLFLVIASVVAIAIGAWAFSDLVAARMGYLRLAQSHGHLELAAATYLFLRRDLARGVPS